MPGDAPGFGEFSRLCVRGGVPQWGGCAPRNARSESAGRFDHCTDVGDIPFDSVDGVNTNNLIRVREDTPIQERHTYIYESNVFTPENRTQFTGFDVYYGKVYVESIEQISKAGSR